MHRRAPLVCFAIEALFLGSIAVHARAARARRSEAEPTTLAVARLMPGADLALAGPARHLRFPSLEEPGAAFADGMGLPDTDPAGGAIAPPSDVYAASAPSEPRKRAPEPLGRGPK
jgi:hypothetical protein